MRFIWDGPTGKELEIPFSGRICGLSWKGRRPDRVVFTLEDMLAAARSDQAVAEEYLYGRVCAAIAPKINGLKPTLIIYDDFEQGE